MNMTIQTKFDHVWSENRALQNTAFHALLEETKGVVDWAYEVWDTVIENLSHKDIHNRAIAAQILCNLAKSDPGQRILQDFEAMLNVTKDKRFVTARHCLQSLWKIGLVGEKQLECLINGLETRFHECIAEKNCTLIRYDILFSMRKLFDVNQNELIKAKALELIETEQDIKYRKKYATAWKFK